MLYCDRLTKRYSHGHPALTNISFQLSEGQICCVTGPSGAGKSTLLRLVMGLERPTAGQIIYRGVNLARLAQRKMPFHRRRCGLVAQENHLLAERTLFDNVALPLLVCGVPHRQIGRRVRAALDRVGLLGREKQRAAQLSAGEQRRASIARAVVHQPELLLADEPTANLDPEQSASMMRLLADFNAAGASVLIATQDPNPVAPLGGTEIRLAAGRLCTAPAG
ncbi:MAG: ATP-binding cassette domain-containing protein [Cellvibrionales bacterium]|nr:ATP-binding cassette domain-containing protein [Cellvibrionales bacterium]